MKSKFNRSDELELYDGQRAKLPEKKVTADYIPPLAVTARGKETFALSESLYFRWLEKKQDLKLVDRAVALCREAVALGYPHAVVRMGYYYDKDYIEADRTEEFRCRVATDYYGKVVYADAPPAIEEGVKSEIGWEELRRSAARMLLDMLSASQAALAADDGDRYGFDYHAEQISLRYGIAVERVAAVRAKDAEKALNEVLNACKNNKHRAPLFGVMRLSSAEVKRVFVSKSAALRASADINVWLKSRAEWKKAGNTTKFLQYVEALPEGDVWLCFFNNNLGGHRFLNGNKRRAICEKFSEDNCAIFAKLVKSAEEQDKSALLFSDDDVYYYMKNFTSAVAAAEALVKKVINQEEW